MTILLLQVTRGYFSKLIVLARLLNSANFRQQIRRIRSSKKIRELFGNLKLQLWNFRAVKYGEKYGKNTAKYINFSSYTLKQIMQTIPDE